MREVAALVELHAEHGVARIEQREVHGHVRVGAGVRLHVGVVGAEERLGAFACEILDLVDDLVTAVVALARIALRILVREHRAGGLEYGWRREVLGRDELQGGVLPLELTIKDREELVIAVDWPVLIPIGHVVRSSSSI